MTNPNEARASVPVSQMARQAAAEAWVSWRGKSHMGDEIMAIHEGRDDAHPLVQAFARFEQMTRDDERENGPVRKVVFRYIDRMNDIAPECGDPAERILGEFVKDMNVVLKSQPDAIRQSKGRS